ncbi:hypothetical protein [Oligoflexus tunisiensis]|uniref:hypothetical protein n=1 Tax=Oligoflexus tunisiensis TaxID=708132 RepID=UPI00114CACE1|nr:hypothetical protein [Oligoflexus tunisiensis]
MKISGYLMAAAMFAMSGLAQYAEACTMAPVNLDEQARDMQRYVATALKIEPTAMTNVEVRDATGDYIWSDPMCPEGLRASATFVVRPKDPAESCTILVKVSKTEPTGLSKIPVKHEIKIEIVQQEKCRE